MFDPWCPTCAARVLLSSRRLLHLARTPGGHRAHLRCWCGTVVTLDIAARRQPGDRGPARSGRAPSPVRPAA